MSSLLKAFNNHLMEFLDDVIRIFPENLDIKTGKTFAEGLKKAGYATDPEYSKKLISLIERFNLSQLD